MTELIATFALIASVLLLIVHYRNQVEHRHGEISKLLSDYMQRLSETSYRMRSTQMHIETARLELRRLPECEEKYDLIEQVPPIIKEMKESAEEITQFHSELDKIDTKKVELHRPNIIRV